MTVYKGQITVDTLAGKPTYIDVTKGVADIVAESGIKEGIVTVISAHTTCAVFSEEYDHDTTPTGDTFLQADLSDGLNKIFPEQKDWSTYRYPGLDHFEEVESWPSAASYLPGAIAPCSGTAMLTFAPPSSAVTRRLRSRTASFR